MREVFTSTTKQDLDDKLNEFIENHDVIDWPNVTIVTEIVKDDTPAGYHWCATLVPKDTASTLKDLLVEEHGIVRHFWSKTDIQDFATSRYRPLTDDELEKVAYSLSKTDCEHGISWQTVDDTICLNVDRLLLDEDSNPDEACERDRERHGTDGYENDWTSTEMIGI